MSSCVRTAELMLQLTLVIGATRSLLPVKLLGFLLVRSLIFIAESTDT